MTPRVLISILFPGANTVRHHPLYWLETRSQNRNRTLDWALPALVRWFSFIFCGLFLFWLLFILSREIAPQGIMGVFRSRARTSGDIIALLLLVGLGAGTFLDLTSVTTAASRTRTYRQQKWHLIRLTPLSTSSIVIVSHVLAQLLTWRMMMLVICLRFSAVILLGLHTALIPYDDVSGQLTLLESLYFETAGDIFIFAAMVVLLIFYLGEPFWRMRMFTAFGVLIATRIQRATGAVLAGLGTVAGVWLSYLGLAYIGLVILQLFRDGGVSGYNATAFIILIIICTGSFGLYLYYWFFRVFALRAASLLLIRSD
ncbi:MAG: hypothetical protein ACOCX5_03460 [Chloroflexota bacterium]